MGKPRTFLRTWVPQVHLGQRHTLTSVGNDFRQFFPFLHLVLNVLVGFGRSRSANRMRDMETSMGKLKANWYWRITDSGFVAARLFIVLQTLIPSNMERTLNRGLLAHQMLQTSSLLTQYPSHYWPSPPCTLHPKLLPDQCWNNFLSP